MNFFTIIIALFALGLMAASIEQEVYFEPSGNLACDSHYQVPDEDGDGYDQCDDCNDNDASIHPGAVEICSDGLDNNCNDLSDCRDGDCEGQPTLTPGTISYALTGMCCGGISINPNNNIDNCGMCGNSCGNTQYNQCISGRCICNLPDPGNLPRDYCVPLGQQSQEQSRLDSLINAFNNYRNICLQLGGGASFEVNLGSGQACFNFVLP